MPLPSRSTQSARERSDPRPVISERIVKGTPGGCQWGKEGGEAWAAWVRHPLPPHTHARCKRERRGSS